MSQRKEKCLVITKNSKITYLLRNTCVLHRFIREEEWQNKHVFQVENQNLLEQNQILKSPGILFSITIKIHNTCNGFQWP